MTFMTSFIKGFFKNDVIGMAAQTAFFLVLSIPPLLVLMISAGLNVSDELDNTMALSYIFPESISSVIKYASDTIPHSNHITIISGIGVIFSASGSVWALMRGIYKAHTNNILKFSLSNRLVATLFTVIFIIAISMTFGMLLVGGVLSGLVETFTAFEIAKLGIEKRFFAFLPVFFFIFLLYRFTPGIPLKGKQLLWGTLFSSVCWIAVSIFFEYYITYFTKYTTVYGGIGAFFILILWLFIISIIVLSGAQLNAAVIERKYREMKKSNK